MKTHSIFSFSIISVCALAVAFATNLSAQKNAAPSVFQADKGKFNILLDGKSVGKEEFEIEPNGSGWVAKGTTEIKTEGASAEVITGNLTLQANGAPMAYDWVSKADKTNSAHITFANGIAKIALEVQGARPYEQELSFNSPLVAVLDNNLYHHYAVLARIYDWSKRGPQTLPVLIPQEITPGTITAEATGSATSGGKTYEGLRVTTSDLEVLLLLDANHRLMRLEVPSSKVTVVRE
ncbi:MAG: hypothetical protein JSS69_12755 [Acidobacteria bacterium]|nr:hypothetical protein [Acidobacteriota bacterium]MBS1866776.1 hypothetical protein [Acidobacteriota bacterium]